MSELSVELPWGSPTVPDIPLPPFRDEAEHRRYVRMLQLHLALLDAGSPTLSTVALSSALERGSASDDDDSLRWPTPLELSASLTSWFPAPWTPELLAPALARQHPAAPVRVAAGWRWLSDPDFTAAPDRRGGWTVVRRERGDRGQERLPDDRALVVLWMHHFRERFAFPLAHTVDARDLEALAPASLAVSAADGRDAASPYRALWRARREAALAAASGGADVAR